MPGLYNGKIIIWGFNVEKVDGAPIYWLGSFIGQLLKAFDCPALIATTAFNARNQLIYFINSSSSLPLSIIAARNVLSNLEKLLHVAMGLAGVEPIAEDIKGPIVGSILHFQSVISSELPQINVFFVTPHRAYDMTMLINRGENLLSPYTLNLIGGSKEEVIKDIKEAARCLAFGFPTAVGFHLYRAIEAIIVEDYFPLLGVAPEEYEKNPNLGCYIKILKEKKVDETSSGLKKQTRLGLETKKDENLADWYSQVIRDGFHL